MAAARPSPSPSPSPLAAAVAPVRAAAIAAVTALSAAGCAGAPPPMVVSAAFTDRAVQTLPAGAPAPAPSCMVHVVGLTDARRAPDLLGVINRQAIKSPPETAAWLRTVLGGLAARGLDVDFPAAPAAGAASAPASAPAPAPAAVEARVSLVTAWVTTVSTNFNASAVLHLTATRPGAPAIERDYRGGLSRLNWAGGPDEVKRMVDLSLAKALDGMAADLRGMCDARA